MKKATQEVAMAVTSVFWNITKFPVPPGFDARRVRPCIKRLLEKYGYKGPLIINAVGLLSDVHKDILGALSSSGINLHFSAFVSRNISTLMYKYADSNPVPANIFGICDPVALPRETPHNVFGLPGSDGFLVYSSPQFDTFCWWSLILAESRALEKDVCLETDEHSRWFCMICYHIRSQGFEGFESFTRHLSSQEHADTMSRSLPHHKHENPPPTFVRMQPQEATPEEAVAVTSVFWDIIRFPIPENLDPCLVILRIKRFLENLGYSGPLTIYAVGALSQVHPLTLEALSFTGITLCHALNGSTDISLRMSQWIDKNQSPANILGICDPRGFPLLLSGCNVFRLFPYSSPQQDAFLWEHFLLAEGLLEKYMCSETGESASWSCMMCNIQGQAFEGLFEHLWSQQHGHEMAWLTDTDMSGLSTMERKQPKMDWLADTDMSGASTMKRKRQKAKVDVKKKKKSTWALFFA